MRAAAYVLASVALGLLAGDRRPGDRRSPARAHAVMRPRSLPSRSPPPPDVSHRPFPPISIAGSPISTTTAMSRALRLPAHPERERAHGAPRRLSPRGAVAGRSARGTAASPRRSRRRRAIPSCSRSGAAPDPTRPRCSCTATTTCSRPSRSSSGRRPPSSPRCATGTSTRAAAWTTRGSSSCTSKALEAHLAVRGTLPVNVIVLAEGEEEVGSENLEHILEAQPRAAALRRRGDLRQHHVRARHRRASSRRCAAWPTCRSTCTGSDQRPALGDVRRRRGESGDGARAHPRHASTTPTAAWRSPASTTPCRTWPAGGARADAHAAVRRGGVPARGRRRPRSAASRGTRRSSGSGRAPRAR